MHSSRMRTGRSLTVCCSLLSRGGGSVPGVCGPGGVSGGIWSRGVSGPGGLPARGGVWSRGVSGPGGLPTGGGCVWYQGGCLVPGGFSLPGGGSPYWRPPPVNRMTNRCKNITLATTSLRPATMLTKHFLNILQGMVMMPHRFE